jgi:hypothetical protein
MRRALVTPITRSKSREMRPSLCAFGRAGARLM